MGGEGEEPNVSRPFPPEARGLAYPGQLDVLIPWVLGRSRNVYHFQISEEGI